MKRKIRDLEGRPKRRKCDKKVILEEKGNVENRYLSKQKKFPILNEESDLQIGRAVSELVLILIFFKRHMPSVVG